jgi:hypothetical protein
MQKSIGVQPDPRYNEAITTQGSLIICIIATFLTDLEYCALPQSRPSKREGGRDFQFR